MRKYIFLYYLMISVAAIVVARYDKNAARKKRSRVPEKDLFFIAWFGGALAMFLTMVVIRHKTKHKRFMLGLPLIALVHVILLLLLSYFGILGMY